MGRRLRFHPEVARAASKTLLGTGAPRVVQGRQTHPQRPREAVWSAYDLAKKTWSKWDILKMPDDPEVVELRGGQHAAGDLENGDVLLPLYAKPCDAKAYLTTVARCRFDGKELKFADNGSELSVDIDRGLYEPSLALFQGRFYHDAERPGELHRGRRRRAQARARRRSGPSTTSSDLGSYNTQQHWVTHSTACSWSTPAAGP